MVYIYVRNRIVSGGIKEKKNLWNVLLYSIRQRRESSKKEEGWVRVLGWKS